MKSARRISPVAGVVFLLLFALSISPRKYLHDLFAHHTDQPVSLHINSGPSLQEKGFQCDQLDVVVDFPFTTPGIIYQEFIQPENHSDYPNYYSFRNSSGIKGFPCLRGPPACS